MSMTSQHSHEHTHQVVDGNGHPVHEAEVHEHPHADGPTPTASRHHNYTEEPAVVALGPVTPGQWQCATDEASGKPYVYVTRDSGMRDTIAQVVALSDSGGTDRALANAKLMTFSPALLRFNPVAGGIPGRQWPDRR